MTVYELIQKLTEFPADAKIMVRMYGTFKQIDDYVDEWYSDRQDGAGFDGNIEEIDWKFYGEVIEIDCEVCDL